MYDVCADAYRFSVELAIRQLLTQSSATGGAFSLALGLGLGLVAKAGGAALAKLAGRAGENVEAAASHEVSGAICGLSFAASTLVATPSGERPIATLKVGDQVLAVDPKTGKTTTQTVQQVFLNHDTDLLNVTLRTITAAKSAKSATTYPALDAAHKQRMAVLASHGSHAPPAPAITTTDEAIYTTANHPWLSANRGWVVAESTQVMHLPTAHFYLAFERQSLLPMSSSIFVGVRRA